MSEGRHVFLSYRSTERPFALKLAAALRNTGVQLWVDCLPEGIRPGDDWPRALEEALNTCALREFDRVRSLGATDTPLNLRRQVHELVTLVIESLEE
jgi:hypothetical protein